MALESAIPEELRTDRVCPMKMKENWTPPYPSFVARFDPETRQVGILVLGLQLPTEETSQNLLDQHGRMREQLDQELAEDELVRHHDQVTFTDEKGAVNYAFIAYFDGHEPAREAATRLAGSWMSDAHADTVFGFYVEQAWPDLTGMETLYSSDHIQGVAHLADGLSGEIREHGYWGSTRDRMPAAQTDHLVGEAGVLVEDPPRARASNFTNICMIRSGQDWTSTEGEERDMYLTEVEPTLRRGMDFLTRDGRTVGCLTNRYARVVRADGSLADQSFGMSWWNSLDDLNAWAKDHPTHKAIFGVAMRYLGKHGGSGNLKLTHEVFVMDSGQAHFEYLHCHDRTGLLGL